MLNIPKVILLIFLLSRLRRNTTQPKFYSNRKRTKWQLYGLLNHNTLNLLEFNIKYYKYSYSMLRLSWVSWVLSWVQKFDQIV